MVKNRYKTLLSKLKKQYPEIKKEETLFEKLITNKVPATIIISEPIREEIKEIEMKRVDALEGVDEQEELGKIVEDIVVD